MSISDWLTPGAVLGALGATVALIGWLIRQDRRIEGLRTDGRGLRDSLERYTTREACAETRRCLETQIRAVEHSASEDRRRTDVALERIDGSLKRLEEKIDSIAQRTLPLPRQPTNPDLLR